MKKVSISIILILLLTCLISSAGIQVFKPAKGEVILNNADYTIRWNTSGKAINMVKIRIFDSSGKIKLVELTNSAPNTGQYVWKQQSIKTYPTGSYVIRVKTTDNKLSGDSAPFQINNTKLPQIDNKKAPQIGIVELKALKPPSKVERHRAPAIGQPSNASFTIKTIQYGVDKNGQLNAVWVVVGYNSKTPFSFSKYQGHPQDGPAYMNCKILLPYWPNIPDYKGSYKVKDIFNQRLSVKYKGANHLKCVPELLQAGTGEFELIFGITHSGKVKGLYTKQKKPKTTFFQGHYDYCITRYWPKIALRLFVHTKEGVKQVYKEFYLKKGVKFNEFTIPGIANICNEGPTYW